MNQINRSRSKFIELFRIDELAHRQTSDPQLLDRLMISRERTAERSKQISKATRINLTNQIQGSGSGKIDIQMSSRNQSKSLIEPIYIESQKNQLDSHSRPNLRRSFANDATQNSTRGVLFGPIQGYSEKQPGIISKPCELPLHQKRTKITFARGFL